MEEDLLRAPPGVVVRRALGIGIVGELLGAGEEAALRDRQKLEILHVGDQGEGAE